MNVMFPDILIACALRPDLALLPDGDMTEVGEKGERSAIAQERY